MFAHLFSVLALMAAAKGAPMKLRPPGYIAATMRDAIAKRMERHGQAAVGLSMGVILLEHDEVGALAEALANQPGFARPRAGEKDTLSASLPAKFFDLQDQLRARANDLAKVAASHDNRKLHAAYTKLTATCMACHALYLNGPGSEEEWWPGDAPEVKQ